MITRILCALLIAAVAALSPLAAGTARAQDHSDDTRSEHDHAPAEAHGPGEVDADHGGAEHGENEDGDDHGENEGHDHEAELAVSLSGEAFALAGIRLARARLGGLERTIALPGEIGFNEDRLVHVTPRYPGVVREVHGYIGEYVREGDLLVVVESNESLAEYVIRTPLSGRIIEKHVSVGEFVAEDRDLYLIADLTTVWANCEVYAKDMAHVKEGASVVISPVEDGASAEATLSYVAPVYSEHTRSAVARAVLANNGNTWRPGTFIRATIPVRLPGERLTVATEAVQVLGEEHVVFVPGEAEGEFEAVAVTTGARSESTVEIVSGLRAGDTYVAEGAFELKAKMVTANLGAHAGHGH